ncbi:MAG: hypothetical protein ABJB12_22240 [Pseudomonadota bacterium]
MRSALALSIPFLFLAAACTYDNGDAQRIIDTPEQTDPTVKCGTIESSTIDVDRQIEIEPAGGAGVYVEYAAGGHWHVRTSCDTGRGPCAWDVLVSPDDGHVLSNLVPEALESNDSLHKYANAPGTWQLNANTSSDLDGFTFDSDPGAAVQIDALLDGTCAVGYFYWVGDGALHSGSPSNPLILVPSPE